MPLRVIPRRDRKLNRFVKAASFTRLRRGEVLWREGAEAGEVALVREGHLLLVDPGPSGRVARTVALAGPWELAGEEALWEDPVRPLRAVAGEASQVQLLAASSLRSVLRSSLRTFGSFMEAQGSEMNVARRLAAGSGGPPARARVAAIVADLARRLGGEGEEPVIPIRVTHRTLADLAGVHRSTVTTILNDWIYEGVLGEADTGIRVKKLDRLLKAATAWSSRRRTH